MPIEDNEAVHWFHLGIGLLGRQCLLSKDGWSLDLLQILVKEDNEAVHWFHLGIGLLGRQCLLRKDGGSLDLLQILVKDIK
ncbi:hypothetical protein RHGRI_021724 [Rhododendron griersonianum]|uniref:Uncharacterized protein n=1 Tax=Rhododendron griersonianum TaxID=479676 RepID=A0AAV6JN18_9ERIC|nr:hypothetical protein RHGRI_021724 [Rhododendron griersonianum]